MKHDTKPIADLMDEGMQRLLGFMEPSYYNTNHEKGDTLSQSKSKARTQQEKILTFLSYYPEKSFIPSQIKTILFSDNTPITSVRRSLSNLKKCGFVVKSNDMVPGIYGKNVHKWRFKTKKR